MTILYEYHPLTGFLIGWHEDATRPNSTDVPYGLIPPNRARWDGAKWVDDSSAGQAEAQAARLAAGVAAVQARLDAQAQAWGYDSIFTACTYAEEPSVPRFQAEGRALRAWRSATWAAANAAAATAQTVEELLAALPVAPTRPEE